MGNNIPLRCTDIARDSGNLQALEFYFNRVVTSAEMRFLHDVMSRAAACMPEDVNISSEKPRE